MPDGLRLGRHRGKFCVVWYEGGKHHRVTLGTDDRAQAERLFRRFTEQRPDEVTAERVWTQYRDHLGGRATARQMESDPGAFRSSAGRADHH